jgi:hypothetical protein
MPDATPNAADQLPEWRKHFVITDPMAQVALDESAATEAKFAALAKQRGQQNAQQAEAAYRASATANRERVYWETLTDDQLRNVLLDCIHAVSDATIKLQIAESNVARAKQRMQDADDDMAEFTDLDEDIASWTVERIKADESTDLPVDLLNAQQARGRVIDKVHSAHIAHDRLQQELKEAAEHLADVESQRAKAALAVVTKSTDAIADELEAALATVINLRQRLSSMAGVWLIPGSGALPLTSRARNALLRHLDEATPHKDTQEATRDWYQRLLTDADATPSEGA